MPESLLNHCKAALSNLIAMVCVVLTPFADGYSTNFGFVHVVCGKGCTEVPGWAQAGVTVDECKNKI